MYKNNFLHFFFILFLQFTLNNVLIANSDIELRLNFNIVLLENGARPSGLTDMAIQDVVNQLNSYLVGSNIGLKIAPNYQIDEVFDIDFSSRDYISCGNQCQESLESNIAYSPIYYSYQSNALNIYINSGTNGLAIAEPLDKRIFREEDGDSGCCEDKILYYEDIDNISVIGSNYFSANALIYTVARFFGNFEDTNYSNFNFRLVQFNRLRNIYWMYYRKNLIVEKIKKEDCSSDYDCGVFLCPVGGCTGNNLSRLKVISGAYTKLLSGSSFRINSAISALVRNEENYNHDVATLNLILSSEQYEDGITISGISGKNIVLRVAEQGSAVIGQQ